MEERNWDQMDGEDDLWYGRFMRYLRMGSKRSVNALCKRTKKDEKGREINAPGAWYDVEKEWKWKERARVYDESVRAEEDRVIAEERDKVLRSGFALQHKRIVAYDRLADRLIGMTKDEAKIWLPDVKSIQVGLDTYERVDLVHFNAPLFAVIDKYLSAIAAEMGERVKKKEITGKDGEPVEFEIELVGKSPNEDEDD